MTFAAELWWEMRDLFERGGVTLDSKMVVLFAFTRRRGGIAPLTFPC